MQEEYLEKFERIHGKHRLFTSHKTHQGETNIDEICDGGFTALERLVADERRKCLGIQSVKSIAIHKSEFPFETLLTEYSEWLGYPYSLLQSVY